MANGSYGGSGSGGGRGSAKDRRTRLYSAMGRRPNQSKMFRNGAQFLKTGDNKYEKAVTFSFPGSSQKTTMTKRGFWEMMSNMEREYERSQQSQKSGNGNAQERRKRLYSRAKNRRPNQRTAFRAGSGNQLYRTGDGKYKVENPYIPF